MWEVGAAQRQDAAVLVGLVWQVPQTLILVWALLVSSLLIVCPLGTLRDTAYLRKLGSSMFSPCSRESGSA